MNDMYANRASSHDPNNDDRAKREVANPDRMEDLIARAAKRREEQASHPQRFHSSWFDPDPDAITRLAAKRHPVTAYMQRTRGSKASQKSTIRTLVSVLSGQPRSQVSWEVVLAFPWHHVGPDEAQDAFRALAIRYTNLDSQHHYVQTLRTLMKECRIAKLISVTRLAEVLDELPTTSKRGQTSRRRRLTAAELSRLMDAAALDALKRAARNRAIIAVFATTGMRVSELVALNLKSWDRREQVLRIDMTKNGRPHTVPVDPRTAVYLTRWVLLRGQAPGPLFVRLDREDRLSADLSRLTGVGVLVEIRKIAKRAGIGPMGTHDFRRTVASTLLRSTDPSLVSALLNHSDLAATLRYDMATEDEQRTAISSLPLPEDQGRDDDGDGPAGKQAS